MGICHLFPLLLHNFNKREIWLFFVKYNLVVN